MNATRKSSKPLEGTRLLRRPMPAGSAGGKAESFLTLSLQVTCFLDYTEHPRQARGERPGTAPKVRQVRPLPIFSLPHSTGSSIRPADEQPWHSAIHEIHPPLPLSTRCHSSDVHSTSNPCLSFAPGESHTTLKPPTRRGLL